MPPRKQVVHQTEVGPIIEHGPIRASAAAGKVITEKEARILGSLVKGDSAVEAVASAGITTDKRSAVEIAKHVRRKYTDHNGALVVALDSVGVNLTTIAQKVAEGLEAKKPVFAGRKVVGHTPDLNMRHKYLETTLDIIGGRAPTKQITETTIKTHEETVAIVASIKENPSVLEALRKRLEQRKTIEVIPADD